MAMTIDLVFTCRVPVISAARVGDEQTLTIDASVCDPPKPVVDKDRQVSHRGRRKVTTEYGRWYEGKISTPWISAAERPYWREFFESVAGEEPFQLDATGFSGFDADISELTVFIPDNSFGISRIELLDAYTASFSWREVDE